MDTVVGFRGCVLSVSQLLAAQCVPAEAAEVMQLLADEAVRSAGGAEIVRKAFPELSGSSEGTAADGGGGGAGGEEVVAFSFSDISKMRTRTEREKEEKVEEDVKTAGGVLATTRLKNLETTADEKEKGKGSRAEVRCWLDTETSTPSHRLLPLSF